MTAVFTGAYIPFLHTPEFYVIMTVVAAAVLALCIRPTRREAAVTRTVSGWICPGDAGRNADADPCIEIECLNNGNVLLKRTDVEHVGVTGSMTLTVTQTGFDLQIEERLTVGAGLSENSVEDAVFVFNFLAPERYHIHYVAYPGDRFAAFSLHVRPGIKTRVTLRQ